ncbi:cation:proton antiporter [Caballeronia sp. LZ031]|uniref:cation:proton antiporter domain-containing protein n=1 Tax=Caballeronia sp. LZ031 TaxID=3038556 RepID=UPI00285CD5F1|nr:cation:proton antiporter [Caballeronia sp. LZ031]MDR5845604.1 cation:proton antiporter [Caballeronia sp. LZ031]
MIGGYALANHLHISGPLAMVIAGVMIGNRGRVHAMSDTTRRYVDMFWELIDEILNAVLFVLIGMEVLLITFPGRILLAGFVATVVALSARLMTVGLPVAAMSHLVHLPTGSWKVLTWGGCAGEFPLHLHYRFLPTTRAT